MFKILKYPNPNLLIPSQIITPELFGSGELEEAVKEIKREVIERKNAYGLAAIQVGIRFSLFILREDLEVFCNPEIIKKFGESYFVEEGCLGKSSARVWQL